MAWLMDSLMGHPELETWEVRDPAGRVLHFQVFEDVDLDGTCPGCMAQSKRSLMRISMRIRRGPTTRNSIECSHAYTNRRIPWISRS